ncbi:plasmid mobilization relaxosome protein MobC [Burkholderia multivorans]|uniref:plasmid mobilization relaxosome protein MobC n=1 Tax=Burkholderia multivorans TaxID=87883 RepID=UPI001C23BC29|nr:plasmid mobilization relaxosome protein MobC [Burkholderia multivorans]MBU9413502.1 plasmid mobilization relaxosome protein MobC [Burkholderia multivorans]
MGRPVSRHGRADRIDVPLGDMKSEFMAWCQQQGVSVNDAVRQMVAHVLGADVRQLPHVVSADGDERVSVKVQFSAGEYEAVRLVAQRMGFTLSRFLVAMVRAQVTSHPQLGEREVAALEASNYQLAAIGRNLNQLARTLNANPDLAAQRGRLIVVDALRREIEAHLKTVHDMQRANLARWRR